MNNQTYLRKSMKIDYTKTFLKKQHTIERIRMFLFTQIFLGQ